MELDERRMEGADLAPVQAGQAPEPESCPPHPRSVRARDRPETREGGFERFAGGEELSRSDGARGCADLAQAAPGETQDPVSRELQAVAERPLVDAGMAVLVAPHPAPDVDRAKSLSRRQQG